MFQHVITALLVMAIVIPVGVFFIGERKQKRFKRSLLVNILSFFGILLFSTVFLFSSSAAAEVNTTAVGITDQGMRYLAAALSTGLGTIAAGIATGSAAAAALGALSENEGIMGKALIFVALAEGIAIYGLLISFMILNQ